MRISRQGKVEALESWDIIRGLTSGRTFPVTKAGKFALIPRLSRANDQAIVIPGLDIPLITRVDGSRRLLLGEAYVEGIIDR